MSEPRTVAGRALLVYYEESDGLPDWQRPEVVERILAIEQEAAPDAALREALEGLGNAATTFAELADDLNARYVGVLGKSIPDYEAAAEALIDALEQARVALSQTDAPAIVKENK